MKTRMLKMCIPLALLLAAGCATQSKNDGSGPASSSATSSSPSSASPSGAPSGSMNGTAEGTASSHRPGAPGARSVYYEFDKSNLKPQDEKLIEANADYLRQHADLKVRVEGNADERGSKEYNLALGQRRAESVTRAMGLLGVGGDRVEAVSYGEEKPRASGHDEQAWAQNRRSDIVY